MLGLDGAHASIDIPLRLNADGANPVALRKVVPFHLDMPEDLLPVPAIGNQEGIVDLLTLLAEVVVQEKIVGELWTILHGTLGDGILEQLSTVLARDEEDGGISQLAGDFRRNVLLVEKSVGGARIRVLGFLLKANLIQLAFPLGEQPVELEEDAGVGPRIKLEPLDNALDDGGLARAVGAVKEEHLVGFPTLGESEEEAMYFLLHPFLADEQGLAREEIAVKDPETDRLLANAGAGTSPEELEHVENVLGSRPQVEARVFGKIGKELLERAHPVGALKTFKDLVLNLPEFRLEAHGCPPGAAPERLDISAFVTGRFDRRRFVPLTHRQRPAAIKS